MNANQKLNKISSNAYRFFEQQNFVINKTFLLNQQNNHKIIHVLRLAINDIIYIFNNTNIEYTAKIIDINNKKYVKIIILNSAAKNLESPINIHLIQAITKHDSMDFIVQKATELGVQQITPVITERTNITTNNSQLMKKIQHWQLIAINASCQSGRTIIPKINNVSLLKNLIINTIKHKFILSPNNIINNYNFSHLNLNTPQELMLLVGPEGGFSDLETQFAQQHDFISIIMGPRILRTETAALVAISILQAKFGDLNANINF